MNMKQMVGSILSQTDKVKWRWFFRVSVQQTKVNGKETSCSELGTQFSQSAYWSKLKFWPFWSNRIIWGREISQIMWHDWYKMDHTTSSCFHIEQMWTKEEKKQKVQIDNLIILRNLLNCEGKEIFWILKLSISIEGFYLAPFKDFQ